MSDTASPAGELPAALFERVDESPDELFYQLPRFVTHIEDLSIAALTAYYREILVPGACVLDLMSSWVSHLPDTPVLGRVVGLGMNAQELAANPRLDAYVVQDLNRDPRLPAEAASFDFVFIAVSIQYLTRPLEVLAEVARVLRPAGALVIATSHRCFPTKAIRAFHVLGPADRLRLLCDYVRRAGGFNEPTLIDRSPPGADPLWIVHARGTGVPIPSFRRKPESSGMMGPGFRRDDD